MVVNTCGFIDAAVAESLDAIGEALAENGKVIVTGCLGAKDGGAFVREAHPRVLAVTGPHAAAEVMAAVHAQLPRPHDPFADLVPPQGIKLDAAALRLPQDQRGLQPPLQLLHHSGDARRPRQPADRRGARRGRAPARLRRQGAAGDLAGHQRLRRRRPLPHRLLGRAADQDPDARARHRARRAGAHARRVGPAPLRLPVSARRRRRGADDGRSGSRAACSPTSTCRSSTRARAS